MARKVSWQERLNESCRQHQIDPPEFQVVSDRRGGRTAWSATVIVNGTPFSARYWYDGKNLDNAREDAAERAQIWLSSYEQNTAQDYNGW